MHEILANIPRDCTVLDLGSGSGSFNSSPPGVKVIRADLIRPNDAPVNFVVCSASALPFADHSFGVMILNHSFEHFEDLGACVSEIARVLAVGALLYIAVPDASTLTDRLYRWLARGGGHVNLFFDDRVVPRMITAATGLPHAGTRVLCTSLSFLNRANIVSRPPRKLLLFANGSESFLRWMTFVMRHFDRWFQCRTSIYGWAFYFGEGLVPDTGIWSNVCVRCGSAQASSLLEKNDRVIDRGGCPIPCWWRRLSQC